MENRVIKKMMQAKVEEMFGSFLTGLDFLMFIKMITLVVAVPLILLFLATVGITIGAEIRAAMGY